MHDPSLHLFIDDHHVRNAIAMKRTYGKLQRSREPLLADIDGRWIGWGTVMREADGKYRMWYQSVSHASTHDMASAGVWGRGKEIGFFPDRFPGAIRETQTSVISYAESDDGVKWNKPELGLIEWMGSKQNNIVLDGSGAARQFDGNVTNMDCVSVVRDSDADPAKRYKMICHWETTHCWDNDVSKLDRPKEMMERWWQHRAKYLTTSPDGIKWDAPLVRIKNCEGGDYCGVTRDERNGHWWLNDRPQVGLPTGYCRLAGLNVSDDLYHWQDHTEQVVRPGEAEDYGRRFEHHGFTPFNYGDQDLGFLEISIGGQPIQSLLLSHRDGQPWHIVSREPVLEVGPKGSRDGGIAVVTRNAPFVEDKKVRFIYNGRDKPASPGIRRFGGMFAGDMRLDGFVGMTVDRLAVQRFKMPAVLQTRAMPVRESQLQINIEGHGGSAKVAMVDEAMYQIEGYRLADCMPIDEDVTRGVVRWKDKPDLSALKGNMAGVLVQLDAGTVYSIRL